MDEEE
jgi:hypothetical protein